MSLRARICLYTCPFVLASATFVVLAVLDPDRSDGMERLWKAAMLGWIAATTAIGTYVVRRLIETRDEVDELRRTVAVYAAAYGDEHLANAGGELHTLPYTPMNGGQRPMHSPRRPDHGAR